MFLDFFLPCLSLSLSASQKYIRQTSSGAIQGCLKVLISVEEGTEPACEVFKGWLWTMGICTMQAAPEKGMWGYCSHSSLGNICHSKTMLLRTLVKGEHQGGENRKCNVGSQDCSLLEVEVPLSQTHLFLPQGRSGNSTDNISSGFLVWILQSLYTSGPVHIHASKFRLGLLCPRAIWITLLPHLGFYSLCGLAVTQTCLWALSLFMSSAKQEFAGCGRDHTYICTYWSQKIKVICLWL